MFCSSRRVRNSRRAAIAGRRRRLVVSSARRPVHAQQDPSQSTFHRQRRVNPAGLAREIRIECARDDSCVIRLLVV
jgi:hypothetical protein